jgi:glycosyltransferase involved in cell wall biosynthesis
MRKILILNSWQPSYTNNFFDKIEHALKKEFIVYSYNLVEISLRDAPLKWLRHLLLPNICRNNIVISRFPKIRSVTVLLMIIRGFLLSNKFDIVYCNSSIFSAYIALGIKIRNHESKVIVQEHRGRFINPQLANEVEVEEIRLLKLFAKFMRSFIWCGVSMSLASALKRELSLHKVHYLPNIVQCSTPIKQKNRVDVVQFIYVGAINEQKNVEYALKVFAEMARLSSATISLTLVGEGPDLARLRRDYSQQLVNDATVNFLGALPNDEVHKLMSESDILLHLSKFESFGMVIKEAHMNGLPAVVMSGSGGAQELVEEVKHGGIVVDGSNYIDDAKAILQNFDLLISVDKQYLSASCANFSSEKYLEKFKKIINE